MSFSSQGKQSQEASFIACGQLSIICFLNYEKWDGNKITRICSEQLCSPKQVWELFRVCGVHREWCFHFNLFKYKVCISENANFVALLRNRQFAQVLWFLRYNSKECIYKGNKTLFGWDKGECLGRNFVSISLWFRSVWVVFHLSCIDGKHNPVIGISHLILQQIISSVFFNPLTSHEGQECVRCYSWAGQVFSMLFCFCLLLRHHLAVQLEERKTIRKTDISHFFM